MKNNPFNKIRDRSFIACACFLLLVHGPASSQTGAEAAGSAGLVEASLAENAQTGALPDNSRGQVFGDYIYERPDWFTFLTRVPLDLGDYWKTTFRKDNLPEIGAVVTATGLLIISDQAMVDETQALGRRWHIGHDSKQKAIIKFNAPIGHYRVNIGGPNNWGNAMYFIGDGWVDFGLAAGFLSYGLYSSDNRALQTSSQIVESILASGFVVQVLKHVTGRENPYTATAPTGKWRIFPNQFDYANNVAKYDAMPSGHLAAGMATLTVIGENYPERKWIRPLGYTLLGILSFQMLNNGVHWASDYPLAVAFGYSFGRIAVNRGRTPFKKTSKNSAPNRIAFGPAVVGGAPGIKATLRFP